ncbi:Pinin [Smittium culicis]|uniref:Pinin n=1 Tax=Smittium culicis TaxID=133412 RepID=A0A1R1YF99_9FUNG|nr:Pinin [Smittium culicis]
MSQERNDLTLSPGRDDVLQRSENIENIEPNQQIEPSMPIEDEPLEAISRNKKLTEQGSKAAFSRLVGTLAKVKQDLQVKSDKQKSKEDLESRLREKLFKERMEVFEKKDKEKVNSTHLKESEKFDSQKRLYKAKIVKASKLRTKTTPILTFIPAKLSPYHKKIIDSQIAKVKLEFSVLLNDIEFKNDADISTLNNSSLEMDLDS